MWAPPDLLEDRASDVSYRISPLLTGFEGAESGLSAIVVSFQIHRGLPSDLI